MVAAKYNLKMEQGATFLRTLSLTDDAGDIMNLTGYVARMQVRSSVTASSTILDMSTTGNYMSLDGPTGTITINVPATVTSTLTTINSVYDLEIESSTNVVTRLIEGSITLDLNVTR